MSYVLALVMTATLASAQSTGQVVSADDLRREVETVITQRLHDVENTARIHGVNGLRDQLLPAGVLKLDVGTIAGRWPRARAGVPVKLMVDGRVVRVLTAWIELTDMRSVLTYAETATAKSQVESLHLVAGAVDMTCCAGASAPDAASLEGQRVRRAVRAGEPVMLSDFEPMPDVAERQQVAIEVVRGPVRLTTIGTALADGRIGQIIAVRPDASEQVVWARVSAKKKVILDEKNP